MNNTSPNESSQLMIYVFTVLILNGLPLAPAALNIDWLWLG